MKATQLIFRREPAVQVVFGVGAEVIAMHLELPEAVVQARAVEAEYRCEGGRAEVELSLAAVPTPRKIYGRVLHPILPVLGEWASIFLAWVVSTFCLADFCVPCLSLSTATETMPRQRLAEKKVDYRE